MTATFGWPFCVWRAAGDIAGRFAHAWPTTTRHLRALVDARLLRHERDGRSRVYSIEPARLRLIADWIAWFQKPLTPPE